MALKDVGNKVPIYKLKTTNEVMKYYDEWGEQNKYNKDMVEWNYTGPQETVEVFKKYELNKDSLIFDAGCGTGLVGIELKKYSYDFTLDGIDVSEKMIEKAQAKQIYNKIFNIDLHKEDFKEEQKYNFIISSGVFLEGHVNFDVINKLYKILEKDGIIIVTIRNSYKDKNKETFDSYFKNNSNFKSALLSKIDYLKDVECSLVVLLN